MFRKLFSALLVLALSILLAIIVSRGSGYNGSAKGNLLHTLSAWPRTVLPGPMSTKRIMSKLTQAKITPHPSAQRGHADHGWLNTYHTFNFASFHQGHDRFGSLRVLNEDRVAPTSGFPTHPHSNFEIFSYILAGELTHRDSMLKKGAEDSTSTRRKDDFYRMQRGDVQFTTGGTGIAHSEFNEREDEGVHFLQIWALPWKRGLSPRYHTRHFGEEAKRKGFVKILSPLRGGINASAEEESVAEPAVEGTIPIHADFLMGAGLIGPDRRFKWSVGGSDEQGGAVVSKTDGRRVYIHLPMTKNGAAKIRLDGRESAVLGEGDGAFVEGVKAGDLLSVESIGEAEAEVIVLDSD